MEIIVIDGKTVIVKHRGNHKRGRNGTHHTYREQRSEGEKNRSRR